MFVLPIILLYCTAFLIHRHLSLNPVLALFSALSAITVSAYLFGFAGLLAWFAWFICIMIAGLLAFSILTRRHSPTSDLLTFFSLPTIIITFGIIYFLYAQSYYSLARWDEYSFYGHYIKYLCANNTLPVPPTSFDYSLHVPQAAALFQYFMLTGSPFSEGLACAANSIFIFICLMQPLSLFSHRSWIMLATITVILISLPYALDIGLPGILLPDGPLAYLFGATAIFAIALRDQERSPGALLLAIPLFLLPLTKLTGLYFAIIVIVIAFFAHILPAIAGAVSNGNGRKKLRALAPHLVILAVLLAAPLVATALFNMHAQRNGVVGKKSDIAIDRFIAGALFEDPATTEALPKILQTKSRFVSTWLNHAAINTYLPATRIHHQPFIERFTPNAAGGPSQRFSITATDRSGAGDIAAIQFWVVSELGESYLALRYRHAEKTLEWKTDRDPWTSIATTNSPAPGQVFCRYASLDRGSVSALIVGDSITLDFELAFHTVSFAGNKILKGLVLDNQQTYPVFAGESPDDGSIIGLFQVQPRSLRYPELRSLRVLPGLDGVQLLEVVFADRRNLDMFDRIVVNLTTAPPRYVVNTPYRFTMTYSPASDVLAIAEPGRSRKSGVVGSPEVLGLFGVEVPLAAATSLQDGETLRLKIPIVPRKPLAGQPLFAGVSLMYRQTEIPFHNESAGIDSGLTFGAIARGMINTIANIPVNYLSLTIGLGVWTLFLILFWRREDRWREAGAALITFFIGFLIYSAGVLYTYIGRFSTYEARIAASFDRYHNTFLAAWLLVLLFFSLRGFYENRTWRRTAIIGVLAGLLFGPVIVFSRSYAFHQTLPWNLHHSVAPIRAELAPIAAEIIAKTPPDAGVFLIVQNSNGFEFRVVGYEIAPRRIPHMLWSFGDPYSERDIWTKPNPTPEQWSKILADFQFIAFVRVDENFINNNAGLFNDLDDLSTTRVFRIEHTDGGTVRFYPEISGSPAPQRKEHR